VAQGTAKQAAEEAEISEPARCYQHRAGSDQSVNRSYIMGESDSNTSPIDDAENSCKVCCVCSKPKPLENFYKDQRNSDGRVGKCKTCWSKYISARRREKPELFAKQTERSEEWAKNNPDKILQSRRKSYEKNKEKMRAASSKWKAENVEKNKAISALWLANNRARSDATSAKWTANNRAHINRYSAEYTSTRMETDFIFALKIRARHTIAASIKKRGYTKRSRTHEILGCDWAFFKSHIERQFLNGMTWEKMGCEIHIDHIVPMATAYTEEDVLALNHFTNLRPMWAKDNLIKNAKRTHLI